MSPRRLEHSIPPGSTLEFLRVLWELDHALQRRSKRMASEHGITGPQRLVLTIVRKYPGLPAGELARLLHLHPSTLTGILARLEKRGWITRRVDPRDARRALFGLSSRGHHWDEANPASLEADVQAALAGAEAQDLKALFGLLRAVSAALARGAPPSTRADRTAQQQVAAEGRSPTKPVLAGAQAPSRAARKTSSSGD